MFYRRKYYLVKEEFVDSFNKLFNEINLPNQLKHGSRLVGRWMTAAKDGTVEIFAIWEYNSYEEYLQIEAAVRSDQPHVASVKGWYEQYGGKEYVQKNFFVEVKDEKIVSTVKKNDE